MSRRPGAGGHQPQSAVGGGSQRRRVTDPVAAAVDAMGKAVQQLTTEQTKEALTHEMAASRGCCRRRRRCGAGR